MIPLVLVWKHEVEKSHREATPLLPFVAISTRPTEFKIRKKIDFKKTNLHAEMHIVSPESKLTDYTAVGIRGPNKIRAVVRTKVARK